MNLQMTISASLEDLDFHDILYRVQKTSPAYDPLIFITVIYDLFE